MFKKQKPTFRVERENDSREISQGTEYKPHNHRGIDGNLRMKAEVLQAKTKMLKEQLQSLQEPRNFYSKSGGNVPAEQYSQAYEMAKKFVTFAEKNPVNIVEIEQEWQKLQRTNNSQLKGHIDAIESVCSQKGKGTKATELQTQQTGDYLQIIMEQPGNAPKEFNAKLLNFIERASKEDIKQIYKNLKQNPEVPKESIKVLKELYHKYKSFEEVPYELDKPSESNVLANQYADTLGDYYVDEVLPLVRKDPILRETLMNFQASASKMDIDFSPEQALEELAKDQPAWHQGDQGFPVPTPEQSSTPEYWPKSPSDGDSLRYTDNNPTREEDLEEQNEQKIYNKLKDAMEDTNINKQVKARLGEWYYYSNQFRRNYYTSSQKNRMYSEDNAKYSESLNKNAKKVMTHFKLITPGSTKFNYDNIKAEDTGSGAFYTACKLTKKLARHTLTGRSCQELLNLIGVNWDDIPDQVPSTQSAS